MNASDEIAGPMNLGNPEEITIRELAERILDLTGSKARVRYAEAAENDPRRRRPDISFAATALCWKPVTALVTGLQNTIDYFDDFLRGKAVTDSRQG